MTLNLNKGLNIRNLLELSPFNHHFLHDAFILVYIHCHQIMRVLSPSKQSQFHFELSRQPLNYKSHLLSLLMILYILLELSNIIETNPPCCFIHHFTKIVHGLLLLHCVFMPLLYDMLLLSQVKIVISLFNQYPEGVSLFMHEDLMFSFDFLQPSEFIFMGH